MAKLILMRHGQSAWNKKNLFTGWVDIPLSAEGVEEAIAGGKKISTLPIDLVFTSTLVRSHMTLALALLQHESGKIPVFQHPGQKWSEIHSQKTLEETLPVYMASELNERMYGELQGKNKAEMAAEFGAEQVQIWRRSFDTAPPNGESLAMTAARTLPYFKERIVPELSSGKNVFVCAHGNSLRSIVMHLDRLSKEEVLKLELATGQSIVYEFDGERHARVS